MRYLFSTLLSSLAILTFFYQIGKSIVLPLAFSSALSVFGSIVVFPSSVSAQFTARLQGVLTPLISALDNHRTLLNTPFPIQSDSSSMDLTKYTEKVTAASNSIKASETALGALAATAGLMKSDLIYGRFSPMDFKAFQMMCRRMSGRANGLAAFFSLTGVGPGSDSGMGALRTTANTPSPDTPVDTALAGPSTSSFGDLTRANIPVTHASTHSLHSRSKSTLHQDRSHSHIQLPGPHSRLHYDKPQKGQDNEYAVGIFENQRYYNMEATKFWDPNKEHWTRKSTQTLGERWVCFPFVFFLLSSLWSNAIACLFRASFMKLISSQLRHRPRSLSRGSHRRKDLVRKCSPRQTYLFVWNPTQRER